MPAKRKEVVPPLMSVSDFAALLGVKVSNLDQVANLPAPLKRREEGGPAPNKGGRLWLASEALEFAEARPTRRNA
jgi:hypothetical protein